MNLTQIIEKFGKEAKIIFVFRHGKKTEDGKHITVECLKSIVENGVPGASTNINTIHRGSAFVRTEETVLALKLWIMRNGGEFLDCLGLVNDDLSADPRLANEKVFKVFTPEILGKKKSEGLSNYEVMEKYCKEDFEGYQYDLRQIIEDLLENRVCEGDVCAVPAHTPTVEIIYNTFTAEKDPKFEAKELEGIFVVEDEKGERHAFIATEE